jgi:16S rRNA (cytidine1402-2'-O)-methyltransferase
LLDGLGDIQKILGNRQISIGRELTKLHEEIFRGTVEEALEHYTRQQPRGEFTLIVAGSPPNQESWTREELEKAIQQALNTNQAGGKIASQLAKQSGWRRREIYQLITEIQKK